MRPESLLEEVVIEYGAYCKGALIGGGTYWKGALLDGVLIRGDPHWKGSLIGRGAYWNMVSYWKGRSRVTLIRTRGSTGWNALNRNIMVTIM